MDGDWEMGKEDTRLPSIIELAVRNVSHPMVKHADWFSWLLFAISVVLVIVTILLRQVGGHATEFYNDYYALLWYGAWFLLVIATVGPLFHIARKQDESPVGVLLGVAVMHLIVFLLMSVVVLLQVGEKSSITGLMAAVAAAGMVGIGWVVQYQTSARASRRAHTFMILMQSRLSNEFQDQVATRRKLYPADVEVPMSDVVLLDKKGLDAAIAAFEVSRTRELALAVNNPAGHTDINARFDAEIELAKQKNESLQGVRYLLNFYEFICAGIRLREIDEPLIRASLIDIAKCLYSDTRHLRAHCRIGQDNVYVELDRIVRDRWGAAP